MTFKVHLRLSLPVGARKRITQTERSDRFLGGLGLCKTCFCCSMWSFRKTHVCVHFADAKCPHFHWKRYKSRHSNFPS